ncbi:MAG: elongation factor G [Thermomicrobiales bacterium]
MQHYPADRIRTVGLFSHGGAGKTSLTEALLFDTGAINRLGRVDDGTTTSDYDPDEVKRRHSIVTAVAPVEWRETKVNVLDPPGYAEFTGEAEAARRVCDAALILLDASAGVEVGTEHVWEMAARHQVPRLIFINKMDRENANFDAALQSAREVFGKAVAPIQFPIGSEKSFKGFVNLLQEQALFFHDNQDGGYEVGPIPAELELECERYRRQIVEAIAEQDEELMVRYLDDDPIATEELVAGLRHCVQDGCVIPVLCGSATDNRGMPPLLDAIVDYVPSAAARVEEASDGTSVTADPDGPLVAVAFKTLADPHVGRLTIFRVFSGTFESNSHAWNASRESPERVGHLFFIRGKEHLDVDRVGAGDLVAVAKLSSVLTGDTLATEDRPLLLDGITFPEPSFSASVTPHSKGDLDKMGQVLHRLTEEDPSLHIGRDPLTGETVVSGVGEPHLQIALERMTRRFGVHVDLGMPKVAYRETIMAKAVSEYKHKKQTGGAGQYGHVILELEPLAGVDGEFEFADRVVGGAVPKNYFAAVEKGVREAMECGPLAGYPAVKMRVTLTDGSYHPVDSNEMAFKIAAKEAAKRGMLSAQPALLEPVLSIWVTVPESILGDVMGDLTAKRAHVAGMQPASSSMTTIQATVPAAEVQRYAIDLRSISHGRGHFRTEFSHYQPVPAHIAEHIQLDAAHNQAA